MDLDNFYNSEWTPLPICVIHGKPHKPGSKTAARCAHTMRQLEDDTAIRLYDQHIDALDGPPNPSQYRWALDTFWGGPVCPICCHILHKQGTGSGDAAVCMAAAAFMDNKEVLFGAAVRDAYLYNFLTGYRGATRRTMYINAGVDVDRIVGNPQLVAERLDAAAVRLDPDLWHGTRGLAVDSLSKETGPLFEHRAVFWSDYDVAKGMRRKAIRAANRWSRYAESPEWWSQ